MAKKLDIWGNESTMNLENILLVNIQSSPYFKDLYRLKTYHEVVDEIYNEVQVLEPWVSGTKVPSTAFCLLYKMFTLRLTLKQLEGLINHPDSPYIRGIGFLYLRYVCNPKELWSWFEFYIDDEEEIHLSGSKFKPTTIGKFCKNILLEQRYFDTLFPRIPVPVMRELRQQIEKHEEEVRQQMESSEKQKTFSKAEGYLRDRDLHNIGDHRDSRADHDDHRSHRYSSPRHDHDRHRDRHELESRRDRYHSPHHDHHHRHHHHYDQPDQRRRSSRSSRDVDRISPSIKRKHREGEYRNHSDRERRSLSRERSHSRSSSPSPSKEKRNRKDNSLSPRKPFESNDSEGGSKEKANFSSINSSLSSTVGNLEKIRALYGASTSMKINEQEQVAKLDNSCQEETITLGLKK